MRKTRASVLLVILLVSTGSIAGCAAPARPATSPLPTSSRAPGVTLLDLGDSNVYGDPGDCRNCTTFPHLVAKELTASSGKTVRLLDGSQHNGLTAAGLLSEIVSDNWQAATRGAIADGPRATIAKADIITITVAANDVPWGNDTDPCNFVYDAVCVDKIATPYVAAISGILDEIVKLRAGKPTAIRVTNYYNEVLAGPDYAPNWPPQSIQQGATGSKTLIETMNSGICAAAVAHAAVCVDIYHAINGPDGLTPLPNDWFDPSGSDLLQPGQDFSAKQLESAGWAPLSL